MSTSASSSDELSEDEVVIQPLFIKRKRGDEEALADNSPDKSQLQSGREAIDDGPQKKAGLLEDTEVTDSDDLEPEKEYQQWQARELARYLRDTTGR